VELVFPRSLRPLRARLLKVDHRGAEDRVTCCCEGGGQIIREPARPGASAAVDADDHPAAAVVVQDLGGESLHGVFLLRCPACHDTTIRLSARVAGVACEW